MFNEVRNFKDDPLCVRILFTFLLGVFVFLWVCSRPTYSTDKCTKQYPNDTPVFCSQCGVQILSNHQVQSNVGEGKKHD